MKSQQSALAGGTKTQPKITRNGRQDQEKANYRVFYTFNAAGVIVRAEVAEIDQELMSLLCAAQALREMGFLSVPERDVRSLMLDVEKMESAGEVTADASLTLLLKLEALCEGNNYDWA